MDNVGQRALNEEVGADLPARFLGKFLFRYETENEWSAIFEAVGDGPFIRHSEEVSELQFMTVEEAIARDVEGDMILAASVHRILRAGCLKK
jgi:hypothetical protein